MHMHGEVGELRLAGPSYVWHYLTLECLTLQPAIAAMLYIRDS